MGVAKAQLNERAEVPYASNFRQEQARPTRANTGTAVRYFNTEGPVVAERHYCIPPLSRVNLDELLELITDMKYFVLHAPRQTGKTSTLLALQDRLNEEGEYRCLYVKLRGWPGSRGRYRPSDASAAGGLGFQGSRHTPGRLRGQDDVRVLAKARP